MSHVLLIRSLEDALPLASQLEGLGKKVLCYPLFEPQFFPLPPLEDIQALIITSKNALRAIKDNTEIKTTPLYVVGDHTAKMANKLGFSKVYNAGGTSQELCELIARKAQTGAGILYHLSGQIIRKDIVYELQSLGFKAERQVIYQIKDVQHLPDSLITDFVTKRISHVLFFSPRTTDVFVHLVKSSKLEKEIALNKALCLSYDIAEKAQQILWEDIWISPLPSTHSILGYFNDKK